MDSDDSLSSGVSTDEEITDDEIGDFESEEEEDSDTEEALSLLSELSFNPTQGIESDDDNDGCCHWSTTQEDQEIVALDTEENFHHGKNTTAFDDGTSPGNIVIQILNDEWIDLCIDATDEYGRNDAKYNRFIGQLQKDEKERSFVRGRSTRHSIFG
jgi:hypothetical protein